MMWHEARKQEKKIRGMLVDYKKRAERRRDYYEKIKADPTQFLQLHGRPVKVSLDPQVAIAAEVNMMPWQGNRDIMIDRFDVRAHLDYIPDVRHDDDSGDGASMEDRLINYERYRILVQNDFLGVQEEKFLRQIYLEEQFGPVMKPELPPGVDTKPKKGAGVAIGYNYDEPGEVGSTAAGLSQDGVGAVDGSPVLAGIELAAAQEKNGSDGEGGGEDGDDDDDDDDDDSDEDVDFDLCVDVSKIGNQQAREMNVCAHVYGMQSNDFFSFLTNDIEEAENLRLAREREEEKAMYSGRKARRERRAYRDKKLAGRKISPPSYASRQSPTYFAYRESKSNSPSKSKSRSPSPSNTGQVTYITSFGGDEATPTETPKLSQNSSASNSRTLRYKSRSEKTSDRRSRTRSPPHTVTHRRRSRSDSRSRNRSRSQNRSRDLATSRSAAGSSGGGERWRSHRTHFHRRSYRDSRSRSRSRSPRRRRSYSRSRSGSPNKRSYGRPPPLDKSPSPQMIRSIEVPAPPVITRYYGRNNRDSSSELSYSSESESVQSSTNTNVSSTQNKPVPDKNARSVFGNSSGRNKPSTSSAPIVKSTPQERLKKKMQALLNRQYKADKRAERERLEKAEQDRLDRAEEMREISIKMRRRERIKRHQNYLEDNDERDLSSVSSGSLSPASSPERTSSLKSRRRSRSRSRSAPPPPLPPLPSYSSSSSSSSYRRRSRSPPPARGGRSRPPHHSPHDSRRHRPLVDY
ncbi:CLK4-associating serine/arginine rich protein [Nilaparvata lugens]|uniref:CLK4-associating serine/arginine rich protein n=1 Tax=Nilaparvata lugens TaxID=108931 RepID=UPI00193CC983|nr:CLK4-associating serine/arginine rich protein [Nilaparvata lugens]